MTEMTLPSAVRCRVHRIEMINDLFELVEALCAVGNIMMNNNNNHGI